LAVRKRAIVWGVASCVLIGGVAGFLLWHARNRKPQYVTAQVAKGTLQRTVSATGALNPLVTVQVGSYVSGTVKSLACDFNTEVVVGQVCATIDPVPFQLIVDEDKAQVGTAVAQLKKDTAALRYAKLAFERDSKLLKENTVSQDTVDNDESIYSQEQEQLGLDQANIVDKQAALKAAQVNLAYTNIVSPVVGTVITRAVDVGQTVAASLASPTVFLIGKDLTHMQVDTNVSEADVGDVRLGQDASFTVQAFPGKTFKGKVTQIRRGPITVQNVVTYDVVIAVDNPDRKLFPGMTADAHIVIDERDDILKVPLPATRFTPEGVARGGRGGRGEKGAPREGVIEGEAKPGRAHRSRVWVLSDTGELRPVQVQLGIDDGSVIEVAGEGLSEGDKVVINEAGGDARDRSRPQAGPGQGTGLLRAQGGGGQGFRP
jgi:HlyD family secretion protein